MTTYADYYNGKKSTSTGGLAESAVKKTGTGTGLLDSIGNWWEGADFSFFKDSDAMSGAAGLASALTQAIALPDQLKNMRLQRKSMQHNLDTAKQEQARRNSNISGFNSFSNIKGA